MKRFALLPQLLGRYGSAWMLVQHLRVLNALSLRDVGHHLMGVSPSNGRTRDVSTRSLVDLSWYEDRIDGGLSDCEVFDETIPMLVRRRGLDVPAGALAALLGRDDVVRWCPQCLQVGYHALWFQLAALHACPIHGCALEEACRHCHAPLPACALEPKDTPVFECAHCERPLAPSDPQRWLRDPDAFAALEATAFDPLARWFQRVLATPVHWSGLAMDLHVRGNAEDPGPVRAARTRAVLAVVPGRRVASLLGGRSHLRSSWCQADGEFGPSLAAYQSSRWQVSKAVDRMSEAHTQCNAPGSDMVIGERPVRLPTGDLDDFCCVRFACELWKERHARARHRHEFNAPPQDRYLGIPLAGMAQLLFGDFMETVRVLSDYRARLPVPRQRLLTALGLDATPSLGGVVLPAAEPGGPWLVVNATAAPLPHSACRRLDRSACSRTRRGSGRPGRAGAHEVS